jgi:predicted transcriptional regulator
MSKEQNKPQQKFHKEFTMFKDNRKPDYELKNIFEIYLPFWFCRRNVVVEREIELDRFSKIILQTVQNGFTKHSEVCEFLGVETNSFVTTQFHFLLKNGLLNETPISNDTEYEITFEGFSFLDRKKKITAVETIEFEYFYNELTLEFLDKHRFDFLVNDLTKEYVDTSKPLDTKNISEGKRAKFSGYIIQQTKDLEKNGAFQKSEILEIKHKNKPYNLNKVDFANFFNKQFQDKSFYDFESNNIETHKRSICFLGFEYEDKTGVKIYDIRHFKKTVKEFERHELEEKLTKQTTDFYKKNPLTNEKKNEA